MTATTQLPVLPPFKNHSVSRPIGNLSVRDFPGSEPAFVLLHGFPDNSHIYDFLIPHLCKAGRRAIAIDFLGFGASDKPSGLDYNFNQQLEDVSAVVDALGLSKIIPVGHDSGGPAAINFALRHPERVAGVALMNTFYGEAPGLLVPEIIDFFSIKRLQPLQQYILADPQLFASIFSFQRAELATGLTVEQKGRYTDFLGPLIDDNFKQQPSAIGPFASMVGHLTEEIETNTARLAELRKSKVPFTLVWGGGDPYLHVTVAEVLQRQMRSGTLHVLEAGHWPQIDEAGETAKYLLEM